MAVERIRGGFKRPIKLGSWLRDRLASGKVTYAERIYGDYVFEVKAIPLARKGKRKQYGKRKSISYSGFRVYLYELRRLGLIEYVRTPEGEIREEPSEREYLHPRLYFRAVMSEIGNSAWEDIHKAYRELIS